MVKQVIELTNVNKIIWKGDDKLDIKSIKSIVFNYLASQEFSRLQLYDKYYESENVFITDKVLDKQNRNKTPNNYVPTSYYSTVIDTMAGYMFSDVKYLPRTVEDAEYAITLNNVLFNNNNDTKEMKTGVNSLTYNKGIELVYTVGNGTDDPTIRYTNLDPRQVILVYNDDIESEIYCAIRITLADNLDKYAYNIDVIYADEWQYYSIDNKDKISKGAEPKKLEFKECPVIVYNANDMSGRSPFHKIIQYINALDFLITGNANDMEKLADAILILTKILKEEDLKNLNELKAIMDVKKDDRAEYLEKNTDPAFREYASRLLIQEIHKHSHVVDWYSPDSGISGEASGKALRIRLFDMNMYSQRIEKIYKIGSEKRIRLINSMLFATGVAIGDIDIIFNRTLPDSFEELAPVVNSLTFLSYETKLELLGLDVEKEKARLDSQAPSNTEE